MIQKAEIKKFRGFVDVHLDLASQITIIAGQNGTQKTTILGLLTQPFTITDIANPMYAEKPLSGGTFKSAFSEKFKLSEEFDPPKSHEWTLYLDDEAPFEMQSMKRGSSIRFWRKGSREKGTGYIQLPVIFLSLKRLIPIGEDDQLTASNLQTLTQEEIDFFITWHRKILISMEEISDTQYLESPNKNTLGINTARYDWRLNSAGQDNIGKILLAILSFKRLQARHPQHYKGGILAIDELDATIYPGSQLKLFDALRKFSAKLKLQIIFTTHSLTLLEHACKIQDENANIPAARNHVRVVYLEKVDDRVILKENITYASIVHHLNVTVEGAKPIKIRTFTEDKECEIFVRALLKTKSSKLAFVNCTMGCNTLVELASKKVPSFCFPEGIVFVDGDVRGRGASATERKIAKLPNFVILPGLSSPERLIANFLHSLPDNNSLWSDISQHFTKQYCFKDISLSEIQSDRIKAKLWFNSHVKLWGSNANKVINPWIKANQQSVNEFLQQFHESYNKFAAELSTPLLT